MYELLVCKKASTVAFDLTLPAHRQLEEHCLEQQVS